MTKYLLLFALFLSSLIFPQTVTINETQVKYTVRNYYGASPDFSYFQFNSDYDLGHYNQAKNRWMDWVSCYKISLAGVPSGYTIKSIKLTAYITQQEYTPNNFVANISKLPNNTDLSTGSSNAEPLYNAISQASTSIGSFKYKDTLSQDIQSSISSSDFADNYIILGVKDAGSSDNSMAKISISLAITYYLPVTFTIDNNFVDNSGSGTHGQVSIDGTTQTVPSSGISLTRHIGQNLTLSAISPQQDNQGYQRLWHTGAISTSDWRRNNVFKSYNQTYSFAVAEYDGGKTYMANLRKIYNITFNSAGGYVFVNNNYTPSPSPTTVQVVQMNSITASGQWYLSNGIEYSFSHWFKNGQTFSSTFTPEDHGTYTAVFIGKPTNSGENVVAGGYDFGQPIVVTWTDNPNPAVNQYQIWRKVKQDGDIPTLIATVGRGIQTYTDDTYIATNGYTNDLVQYDVRAYYSIEGTYSDPAWTAVFGKKNIYNIYEDKPIVSLSNELPTEYSISNYPNPFNPSTTINYQLPQDGMVTIKVYDMLGREVATLVNENKPAGYYKVNFDASKLTSGVYIYTIRATAQAGQANNYVQSKKMLLMK